MRDGTDKWAKERQAQNIHIRDWVFASMAKPAEKPINEPKVQGKAGSAARDAGVVRQGAGRN